MKATMTTQNMAAMAVLGKRFAERRPVLPILGAIRMTATNGAMQFQATDLDCTLTGQLPADVADPGATCVDAKRLADAVKGCNCVVTLDTADPLRMSIASGVMTMAADTFAAADYPVEPELKPSREMTIPQADLANLLRRVQHAQSDDETRFVLNGVYLERKDTQLRAVAIDGRRLVYFDTVCSGGENFSIILPSDTVEKLLALLTGTGLVQLQVDLVAVRNAAKFTFETITGKGKKAVIVPVEIRTKLIEGQYPNYQCVIPTEHKGVARFNRVALLGALATLLPLCSQKAPTVKLAFSNCCELTVMGENADFAKLEIAVTITGKVPGVIAFNPNFLADAVKSHDCEEIELRLGDDERDPGVVVADNVAQLEVIMPIRLN